MDGSIVKASEATYASCIRAAFHYLLATYPECFAIGQGLWSPWGPGIGSYTTWGFAVACSAGLDLDEDTAYKIVKAICEDKTVQAAAMSSVKGADFVAMTLKYATSPLHPGAIKYFKEVGATIPDRLIQ